MDRKNHWAWPHFAEGRVPLPRLKTHFQQEWEVYVRDFPILLARTLGQGPPLKVRNALAENIYEEQTGRVSQTAPHPELFLRMMEGCGFARSHFEGVRRLPSATAYRSFLDRVSWGEPWVVGAAVLTLFVEGSAREREEIDRTPAIPSRDDLESAVRMHPLVRFHGVPLSAMELVRAHKQVEGGHRRDAWEIVLENAAGDQERQVVEAVNTALELWLRYRDEVAAACGISAA
jgi:pyrroloquinoline-quinone synthase